MKSLKQIIQFWGLDEPEVLEMQFQDLFTDSRAVTEQSVFIAIAGEQVHGNHFIPQAVLKGAKLILTNQSPQGWVSSEEIILVIPELMDKLAQFADWFYDSPSKQLNLMGITGTNGKTSTAFYTAQLLESLGQPTALMGTLGNGRLNQLTPSPNTTLEPVSLQRTLAQFVQQGIQNCVMEVSSHAISLGRIKFCQFACVALTQVSRDHLDFHGTLEAYQQVKQTFLQQTHAPVKVLNLEDEIGQKVNEIVDSAFTYGLKSPEADLYLDKIEYRADGIQACLHYHNQVFSFKTALMGQFNVENIACALGIVLSQTDDIAKVIKAIAQLQAVPGRMQKVIQQPAVIVDYAHTPDGMQAVLQAIKQHQKNNASSHNLGQLWVVFGCGGDRDTGKRPLMGEVAEMNADQMILTNDNPRCESAEQIIEDILQGIQGQPNIELDRKKAIELALNLAAPEDWIAILGKGHETTQIFCQETQSFDDAKVVQHWCIKG